MPLSGIRVAATPLSWLPADKGEPPPWQRVLDEIAAAGFTSTELGPRGFLPEDASVLGPELSSRGLRVEAVARFLPLTDPARRQEAIEIARSSCRTLATLGGGFLVVIDDPGTNDYAALAQMFDRRPEGRDWLALLDGLREVLAVARDHKVDVAIHPHLGSAVFREEEIHRVLGELADARLRLCLDTGHALWAGLDPLTVYRRHRKTTGGVHLRNVGSRRSTIPCALSEGSFDMSELVRELEGTAFDGWVTIDQEPMVGRDALDVARENLAFVEALRRTNA